MVRLSNNSSPLIITILNGYLPFFTYILNNFSNNLEQEILTKMEGCGEAIYGASPIWITCSLGIIKFLKLLVAKGANIEHTSDIQTSPLTGAAPYWHFDVCEFIILEVAHFDKLNQLGIDPLAIAAIMQRKICVELLTR